ncbi:MAG: hypothetical protein COB62_07810 [Piscirickettsiaceae bacterium]|nr:MAG: hypothetical protein COB62_07810 [Piscirickettsiaceae bacterium]
MRKETWLFQQKQSTTFEINRQFQFIFKNFLQKELKQTVANKAMLEVKEFLAEIKRATTKGYFINWNLMSQQVPVAGVDQTVFLNTGDLYLRLALPVLAYLQLEDGQNLMEWLKWSLTNDNAVLLIEHADSLLKAV